jgi:hypothetical protein
MKYLRTGLLKEKQNDIETGREILRYGVGSSKFVDGAGRETIIMDKTSQPRRILNYNLRK